MSKIKFEEISESIIEVFIPPETSMDIVQQLTKSFTSRGLVEDLQKSTLSVRYFYRPVDPANQLADKLIKSLETISGLDKARTPMDEMRFDQQRKNREMDAAARIKPNTGSASTPSLKPMTSSPQYPVGFTPKKYIDIKDDVEKDEDEDDVEKSNYGPKGAKQYSDVDNARRKANNLDPVGAGPNVNAKAISTKPGQLSGKAQSALTARLQAAANKKMPIKRWSPEEIEAENKKRGLKKHSWGQHLPFPSAEEEIMKLAKANNTQHGEDALANQLANVMQGKNLLGSPPPGQPTDEQMFGHLVVTEEMAKANEQKWQGAAFDWLKEAAKPITAKFASEEEELAYWSNIKVSDRDDGKTGY